MQKSSRLQKNQRRIYDCKTRLCEFCARDKISLLHHCLREPTCSVHESTDFACDLFAVRLQGEVPAVQKLDNRIGIIPTVGLRSGREKERIMPAPNGEQRRLGVAEVFLKNWIEGEVRSIIEKEIELNVFIAGALQQSSVQRIGFRRDHLRISNSMRVLPASAFKGQQGVPDDLAVLGGWLSPIAPNRIPGIAQAIFVRIPVL